MSPAVRRPPGRPAGGRQVVDRERLLDAAERVIARDGNGASLEAIALEAGVTKPIVYDRVGSRAELSNALAERFADRLMRAVAAEVSPGPLDHPTLAALFRVVLETVAAHRELFLYVTRGSADDTPERTLYLAGRSAEPLAQLLGAWRADQGHDPAVALPWAYGIIGMLNLAALWWMRESTVSAADMAGQLADLVWSGLDRPAAR